MTRREYLIARACLDGSSIFLAVEAVASTALAHPEWDMDERRTWEEWADG